MEFVSQADSIVVIADGLEIGRHMKVVANHSQQIGFCVKEQNVQLKEETVRAEKIRQHGDTLN